MKPWLMEKIVGFVPRIGLRVRLKNSGYSNWEIVNIKHRTVSLATGLMKDKGQSFDVDIKELKCIHN